MGSVRAVAPARDDTAEQTAPAAAQSSPWRTGLPALASDVPAPYGAATAARDAGPEPRIAVLGTMRIRLTGFGTQLWSVTPRPLTRAAGADISILPTAADVQWALGQDSDTEYDRTQWDATTPAFRNQLEGW